MKKTTDEPKLNEILLTDAEFLESYNSHMPKGYPQVTMSQLKRFKTEHASLFKNGNSWTLDLHRKRLIDWLPQNLEA